MMRAAIGMSVLIVEALFFPLHKHFMTLVRIFAMKRRCKYIFFVRRFT